MRTIERTTAFKRDFKREKRGPHRNLDAELAALVQLLAQDAALPAHHHDHALSGNWSRYRDCHLKPDLVLVYRKPEGKLQLIRLGSHSELFG